jgi:single-strand DNA-binding protein
MNKVILVGRLTRDPDIRYTQGENQMAVARFTLAVDRRFSRRQDNNEQQTADFISCVAFQKTAEFAEKYLHQGTKVVLEGRIQTGSYTNKDGQKVYTTDVVVDDQEFAESKAASQGSGYSNRNDNYGGGNNYAQEERRESPRASVGDGFMNIPDGVEDEGLPFN